MSNVRGEKLSLGDENCFGWVKACDDLISRFHNWKDHAVRKYLEAFIWTPKIGVLNNGLIIFRRTKTEKIQPGTARLGFKILAGNKHYTKSRFYKVLSYGNKWVDISCAADGAKKDRFFWQYKAPAS